MEEKIQIKEDAIRVTENSIKDFIAIISQQWYISAWYITITWILLWFINNISTDNKVVLIFWVIIIIIAAYNILSQKIVLHSDMTPVFENIEGKTYEKYLNSKFKWLRAKYKNARNLVCIKSTINNILFFLLVGFIISINVTI